jgi:hypothetical protein
MDGQMDGWMDGGTRHLGSSIGDGICGSGSESGSESGEGQVNSFQVRSAQVRLGQRSYSISTNLSVYPSASPRLTESERLGIYIYMHS